MYADFNLWITLIIIAVVMGVDPGHVRLPDPAGAQDRRLDAGPHRPQPRRPARPACSPSPTASSSSSRKKSSPTTVDKLFYLARPGHRRDAPPCWPSPSCRSAGPDAAGRRRPHAGQRVAARPSRGLPPGRRRSDASARPTQHAGEATSSRTSDESTQLRPVRHRPARRHRHRLRLRHRQPGGLRHHPRRLVVQQQVQLPRRAALQRPAHQLRDPAWACRSSASCS